MKTIYWNSENEINALFEKAKESISFTGGDYSPISKTIEKEYSPVKRQITEEKNNRKGSIRIKVFTKDQGIYDIPERIGTYDFHFDGQGVCSFWENGKMIKSDIPLSRVRILLKKKYFNNQEHSALAHFIAGDNVCVHVTHIPRKESWYTWRAMNRVTSL